MHLAERLLLGDDQLLSARRDRAARQAERRKRSGRSVGKLEEQLLARSSMRVILLKRASGQDSLFQKYSVVFEEEQIRPGGRPVSRRPILSARGRTFPGPWDRLPISTNGEIFRTFGSKARATSPDMLYNRKIAIGAPKGQSISAIHDGTVMFSDRFKEYGKIMVADGGQRNLGLIADVDDPTDKVEERVATGEVVATVGEAGSAHGPNLFIGIRFYGKPVTPMLWLAHDNSSRE